MKAVTRLALKDRLNATIAQLSHALWGAVDYWNAHKHAYTWKKKPQQQPSLLRGAFLSPKDLIFEV